jgi:type IV pilus assembly protein PilY1
MYRIENIGFNEKVESKLLYNAQTTDRSTPVSAKAGYANAGYGDLWIYFGTGSYIDEIDKFTTDQQYFLGLFDEGAAKATPYVKSDLVEISTHIIEGYALDKDGNIVDLDGDGTLGDAGDLAKYRTLSCTTPDTEGLCNPGKNSWLLNLAIPAGGGSERVISQPLVVAGIVFFTTFVPDGDVCAGNGETWLFAVDWESGEFVTEAVFDINNDNTFNSADTKVKQPDGTVAKVTGIFIGTGRPSGKIAIHNDLLFVGTTGQPAKPIKVNLPDMQAKLRSWQQVFN